MRAQPERDQREDLISMRDLNLAPGVGRSRGAKPPALGGRPRGRPKGSRNRKTLALEALLEESGEALARTLVTKALAGDGVALRFCVGRLLPPERDHPVTFELPESAGPGDLVKAGCSLLADCAQGILTPREANDVMDLIIAVRALEKSAEAERRLTELERRQHARTAGTAREHQPCISPVFNSGQATEDGPGSTDRRKDRSSVIYRRTTLAGRDATRHAPCKSPVFNSDRATEGGRLRTDRRRPTPVIPAECPAAWAKSLAAVVPAGTHLTKAILPTRHAPPQGPASVAVSAWAK